MLPPNTIINGTAMKPAGSSSFAALSPHYNFQRARSLNSLIRAVNPASLQGRSPKTRRFCVSAEGVVDDE